ncbi:hypothetical protein LINPERPRIM_LOCUS2647 [Linum perenne]
MECFFGAQDILDDLTTTIQQHLFSCSPSTEGRNSWVQTTRLQHCFLITPQRISFFTMHCIISNLKVLFLHPKIYNLANYNTNQARHYHIPQSNESCSR